MADDEKCVQVGSFVWKWHESVGWYDVDEDDPTFGNEGVLLDEIVRLRAAGERLKVALLVTSNVWGRQHQSDDDAKYHHMVDVAVDGWGEAHRGDR